ncbi:hypothetical protein HanIR_Chr05g0220321 [Helianthus annuus]|nr:hypothetical protein HanIR_Chr05g0220321 [Helianthus annuus]
MKLVNSILHAYNVSHSPFINSFLTVSGMWGFVYITCFPSHLDKRVAKG